MLHPDFPPRNPTLEYENDGDWLLRLIRSTGFPEQSIVRGTEHAGDRNVDRIDATAYIHTGNRTIVVGIVTRRFGAHATVIAEIAFENLAWMGTPATKEKLESTVGDGATYFAGYLDRINNILAPFGVNIAKWYENGGKGLLNSIIYKPDPVAGPTTQQ